MRGQVWGLSICFSCLVTNAGDVSEHMYTEIKESTCRRIPRDCSYMTSHASTTTVLRGPGYRLRSKSTVV